MHLVTLPAAGEQLVEQFTVGVDVVGMGQLGERPALELLARAAEHGGQRLVGLGQPAVRGEDGSSDRTALEGDPPAVLGVAAPCVG